MSSADKNLDKEHQEAVCAPEKKARETQTAQEVVAARLRQGEGKNDSRQQVNVCDASDGGLESERDKRKKAESAVKQANKMFQDHLQKMEDIAAGLYQKADEYRQQAKEAQAESDQAFENADQAEDKLKDLKGGKISEDDAKAWLKERGVDVSGDKSASYLLVQYMKEQRMQAEAKAKEAERLRKLDGETRQEADGIMAIVNDYRHEGGKLKETADASRQEAELIEDEVERLRALRSIDGEILEDIKALQESLSKGAKINLSASRDISDIEQKALQENVDELVNNSVQKEASVVSNTFSF